MKKDFLYKISLVPDTVRRDLLDIIGHVDYIGLYATNRATLVLASLDIRSPSVDFITEECLDYVATPQND